MKRFLMAIALACVLSGPALAGEMPAVGPAPALAGDMPTVGPAPAPNGTQSSAAATVVLTIIRLVVR